jgi:CRP-like cAMP-binding protein
MIDTPRTEEFDGEYSEWSPAKPKNWPAFARQLERELNAANERIHLLIAERDTARRQADQTYKLRKEFAELLGTDDVERGVAVVREMKERISKLNDYVAALETAGDLMANELSYGYDVDMWNKAKEAKP